MSGLLDQFSEQDRLKIEEKLKEVLSSYDGSLLFVIDEDGDQLENYTWDGPIPHIGDIIYLHDNHSDRPTMKYKVERTDWSTMTKKNPRFKNQLSIRCEIMVREV